MTERVLRLVSSRRADFDASTEAYGGDWNSGESIALSSDDGWRELRRELDRSRRFGREFVLMRLPRFRRGPTAAGDVAHNLRRRLRSIDAVWTARKHAFVLLPEAGRDVGLGLVARLRRDWPDLLPADIRLAAFPADGLTSGALLELLERSAVSEAAEDELPKLDVALHQSLSGA